MNIETNENNNFTENENQVPYTDFVPDPSIISQPPQQDKSKKTKGIIAICVVVLLAVLGYFKMNEDVFRVQGVISDIGVVTLDSKDDIVYAETAYNGLSASEQKRVNNYDVLVSSKEQYNELLLESFESSTQYAQIRSTLNSTLGDYNPKITLDKAKKTMIISLSIDSNVEDYLINYPSLARSSWIQVTKSMNDITKLCCELCSEYEIDVVVRLYPEYSDNLLFESTNGVASYDILD